MPAVLTTRRLAVVVGVAVVLFAFWRALFAGGSLVSHDRVYTEPPFSAHRAADYTLETGPGDPINIHAHWGPMAERVRDGDVGWWNPDLGGGQPTMKGGLPFVNVLYLVSPGWFAPGLVAAVRVLVAMALTAGFLRSVGAREIGALAGALAFGFSGFMVGWMNWPHATVAALLPGLLWAIELVLRRPRPWHAVPLAAAVAAMIWANFPQVAIYCLAGAAIYGLVRLGAEARGAAMSRAWLGARLLPVGIGGALAVALALPHVVGFAGYFDWVDTSHRTGWPDSAAGAEYLLTLVHPALWGSDAVGPAWFGTGNWVEFNIHAGASVTLLALWGAVAWGSGDWRRRWVVAGLSAMVVLGVMVAYVGGPIGETLGGLVGDRGGLHTRAKVLISMGVALLCGLGVDRWAVLDGAPSPARLRRHFTHSAVIIVVLGVVLLPSARHWARAARAIGQAGPALAAGTLSALAGLAAVAVVVARKRRLISAEATGWGLVAVIAVELLFFAMPVPTIVPASEQVAATPAHDVVLATLESGERLGGEGHSFWPNTTAHFGIADVRGAMLKPPGYQALLRAVDGDALLAEGFGTPTIPFIGFGTSPSSPVWDALAVGVWAQFPGSTPPGPIEKPAVGAAVTDLADGPLSATVVVPEGGLRAVMAEVAITHPSSIHVEISGDDFAFSETLVRAPSDFHFMATAVMGESLAPGTELTVTYSTDGGAGAVLAFVDEGGAPVLGTVAGDDEFRLVRTGDVILLERLHASPVRLFDAATTVSDVDAAAGLVAARDGSSAVAVVATSVELPDTADPAAELSVVDSRFATDRIEAEVETDRSALVVLSMNNHPDWRATVDGVDAPIVTADAALIGVVVPPGRHDVVVEFEPAHLTSTGLVFLGGAAVALLLLVQARRGRDLPVLRRTSH